MQTDGVTDLQTDKIDIYVVAAVEGRWCFFALMVAVCKYTHLANVVTMSMYMCVYDCM